MLIHAGSGGVGSLAIQLAKHAGAWVAATANARNKDLVQRLGADQFVDYSTPSGVGASTARSEGKLRLPRRPPEGTPITKSGTRTLIPHRAPDLHLGVNARLAGSLAAGVSGYGAAQPKKMQVGSSSDSSSRVPLRQR